MEGEAAASVAVYMEYMESPAIVKRSSTVTAPVGLIRVQESDVDLPTRRSINSPCSATLESPNTTPVRASSTSQHPPSELPTLMPRDESSTQLMPHDKFKCGSWKTGLEVSMLSGIIIVVWMLFSIPAILYALPPKIREVHLQKLHCVICITTISNRYCLCMLLSALYCSQFAV